MLSALLQVSSRSSSEFDAHQGKVSAAVTAFASGNATLAQAMTQIAELRDVRYIMLRDGGLGDIPTMNDLIDAARTFPTKVQLDPGEPALAALLTADYNSVENLPGVLPIELGFVEKQKRDLNTLAEWLDEAYEIRGDLRYVSTHIDEFTPESVANLDEVWNANEDVVQKLTNTAAERAQTLENVKLPSRPKGSPLKAVRKQGSIVVAPLPQPTKPITPKQIPIHRKIQCHTVGYGPEEVLYTVPDNLIAAVTVEDVVPDGAGYPSYVLQLGIGSNYSDGSPEARPRGRRHETFNQQFRLLAGEQITLKMAGGGFLTVAIKVVEEL
jgi:hypothetical protein